MEGKAEEISFERKVVVLEKVLQSGGCFFCGLRFSHFSKKEMKGFSSFFLENEQILLSIFEGDSERLQKMSSMASQNENCCVCVGILPLIFHNNLREKVSSTLEQSPFSFDKVKFSVSSK